ncbi:MAG: NYN domain-containing protein [Clostridia bacterium]|nr:NYN domain-containing protein [Clostridia bacterium]
MAKKTIALLIDLGSLRVSCEGFKKLYDEIAESYDIRYVKFYSYVAKRNRDFNEYIAAMGYDAVTPVASKRRNRLDTREVIDGTKLSLNSSIDVVGIAFGEGDILPIVSELKFAGKDVLEIGTEKCDYAEAFTGFVKVDSSYLRKEYAAPTKKKEPKQKKVVPSKLDQYKDRLDEKFSRGAELLRNRK